MKFEKLKPGMTLYDVGTHKMGNTTVTTVAVWPVHIISVDAEKRTAVVSWNGNAPKTYGERSISKLRKREPVLVQAGLGMRLANREELKTAQR